MILEGENIVINTGGRPVIPNIKGIENNKNVKGLDTKRRDVIIGGTIILKEILEYFKKDSLIVSENDNLMGAILEGVNGNDRCSK